MALLEVQHTCKHTGAGGGQFVEHLLGQALAFSRLISSEIKDIFFKHILQSSLNTMYSTIVLLHNSPVLQ
jgi:hypothetical protein